MARFSRFSDLPQELRDIIWKFAIRPEGPTAHCLSVRTMFKDDHLVQPQWSIGSKVEEFGPYSFPHDVVQFSAPRCGRDGGFSWVLGNYSAYMEDSALWTTCWDSRSHMIQRFRPYETNRRMGQSKRPPDWLPKAATVTAVLQRDNGERQHFTIRPMEDLIILQTVPDSSISLDRNIDHEMRSEIDALWEETCGNCMFTWRSLSGPHCRTEHIAFEFDPKWLEQTEEYIRKFHGARYADFDTIWFIDDRLQLKPEGERRYFSDRNKVFNAMGRRFVEVDSHDVVAKESGESWDIYEAFDFVVCLEDIENVLMDSRSPWLYVNREYSRCQFKVLACELL